MYQHSNNLAGAAEAYERGIKLREQAQGNDHADVAHDLIDLASVQPESLEKAEELARKSLAICERLAGGKDDARVARPVEFLGHVALARREYEQAIDFHKRTAAREKGQGIGHSEVNRSVENIARVYEIQERFDEAEAIYIDHVTRTRQALGPDHPALARAPAAWPLLLGTWPEGRGRAASEAGSADRRSVLWARASGRG